MGSIRPIKPAPAVSERITAASAYLAAAAHFRVRDVVAGAGGMENREIGEVLVVAGALLFLAGFAFFPICGFGLVLIILGLVVLVTEPPRPRYYYSVPYGYPLMPPIPSGAVAPCPACGTAMNWVGPYGRWYCTRCQAYR